MFMMQYYIGEDGKSEFQLQRKSPTLHVKLHMSLLCVLEWICVKVIREPSHLPFCDSEHCQWLTQREWWAVLIGRKASCSSFCAWTSAGAPTALHPLEDSGNSTADKPRLRDH